jgi:hypothetical protein
MSETQELRDLLIREITNTLEKLPLNELQNLHDGYEAYEYDLADLESEPLNDGGELDA